MIVNMIIILNVKFKKGQHNGKISFEKPGMVDISFGQYCQLECGRSCGGFVKAAEDLNRMIV